MSPTPRRTALRGMVTAADQLASDAGVRILDAGGTAADAAVAAAAVMAVTGPHLCGIGGDMLAMVMPPRGGGAPVALLGVGRAGSGRDAGHLRAEGHQVMPLREDIRAVTVPGAVDGWVALHSRFGRLPLAEVLAPAIALAEEGFPASLLLALASYLVAPLPQARHLCSDGPLSEGQRVRLPQVAQVLRDVATHGRDGFYEGDVGRALLEMGQGLYSESDLAGPLADWCEPVRLGAWGHELFTVPAPSQGYLTLAGAAVAERAGLGTDPTDAEWPHLLMEAARAVGHDRPTRLHDAADTQALLSEERLARAAARIDPDRVAPPDLVPDDTVAYRDAASLGDGDTTHLCALDAEGMGVSLTQSNALDFGSHLVAGDTGIFLHNRGLGFSLVADHPAELAPGRRPPHTLSPALVTRPDGTLAVLLGTMGGDQQPQILMQLAARMLHAGEDPGTAVTAPRVVLHGPTAGPFRLWWDERPVLQVEHHAPDGWIDGLRERGHRVETIGAFDPTSVGCSQAISLEHPEEPGRSGLMTAGSDPRSPEGGAVGR